MPTASAHARGFLSAQYATQKQACKSVCCRYPGFVLPLDAWPWQQRRRAPERCGALRVASSILGWGQTSSDKAKPPPADYVSEAGAGVLSLPLTQELSSNDIKRVFGYRRNLTNFYDIGEMLGAGSFGLVYKATEKSSGNLYAVKTIPKKPKKGKATPRYLLKIQTEVESMNQIGASLNAVFLRDAFEDNVHVHIVMELCSGGPLLERWSAEPPTERDVARQVRSILQFLAQCHAKGVIYRDVKPDNFLFLTEHPDSPLKATDFGLAIRHWPQEGYLKSRSGTPAYMAPEVVMQEYNEKCDLWSTGILMYQMLTGKFPFWDNIRSKKLQEVWKSILVDDLDLSSRSIRKRVSPMALDLLRKLLVREPSGRLSAAEALEHPWIKELDVHPEIPLAGSVVQRLQRFATCGRLKQMVLRSVAFEIISLANLSTLDELRDVFNNIDLDRSGQINLKELSGGLRQQGYNVTDEEVLQLMSRVDLDGDGSIDFVELATALLDWDTLHTSDVFSNSVEAAFTKLDTDNKGYLDSDDLLPLLPAALDNADEDQRDLEAKRMLREIDTLHQGRLHKPEFVAILMESYAEDALSQYDDRLMHSSSTLSDSITDLEDRILDDIQKGLASR